MAEFYERFAGRSALLDYAAKNGIPVTQTAAKPWSTGELARPSGVRSLAYKQMRTSSTFRTKLVSSKTPTLPLLTTCGN